MKAEETVIRRGTARCSLAPATEADFAWVNAHLRGMDRFEQQHFIRIGDIQRPDSPDMLERAWTIRMGGEVVGYVGLQVPPGMTALSRLRFMPMLSTEAARLRPVDYARLSRPVLAWVVRQAPPWVEAFLSAPLARYAASVRWHERTMGWRRVAEYDVGGERAVLFTISRSEVE